MNYFDEKQIKMNINGEEKMCDILFTFDSDDTSKTYIAYSDGTKTDDKLNIFVVSYSPIYGTLSELTDEAEIGMVNNVIEDIKKSGDDINE